MFFLVENLQTAPALRESNEPFSDSGTYETDQVIPGQKSPSKLFLNFVSTENLENSQPNTPDALYHSTDMNSVQFDNVYFTRAVCDIFY